MFEFDFDEMPAPKFSLRERTLLVKLWYKFDGTFTDVIDEFAVQSPGSSVPNRTTIWRLVKRFEEFGTVADKPRSGRPKTSMTEENLQTLAQTFVENSNQSAKRVSLQLQIPRTSLRRLMKSLKLHVYRPRLFQALNEDDFDRRMEFAEWFQVMSEADPNFSRSILWTDEATFKTNGLVNRHNCVYYDFENPNIVVTQELNAPGVCVWGGICSYTIIGPYFHDGTVNGPKYLEMLQEVKIELDNNDIFRGKRIIWQQDGAPCHYATDVRNFLNENFDEWIGRRGKTEWPPRSPDLTPCDFSMWGVLKDRVYKTKIRNLDHLKERIEEEFQILSQDHTYLYNATNAVKKRCEAVIQAEGHHFEHLL